MFMSSVTFQGSENRSLVISYDFEFQMLVVVQRKQEPNGLYIEISRTKLTVQFVRNDNSLWGFASRMERWLSNRDYYGCDGDINPLCNAFRQVGQHVLRY